MTGPFIKKPSLTFEVEQALLYVGGVDLGECQSLRAVDDLKTVVPGAGEGVVTLVIRVLLREEGGILFKRLQPTSSLGPLLLQPQLVFIEPDIISREVTRLQGSELIMGKCPNRGQQEKRNTCLFSLHVILCCHYCKLHINPSDVHVMASPQNIVYIYGHP